MARTCGILVREAEKLRERWFAIHPGIRSWHDRTEKQLYARRFVENRFGFRRYYFDRLEGLLPEALAWIPQSTVAIYINKIWHRFYTELPEVQVLLQVHDSLAGQFSTSESGGLLSRMRTLSNIPIPYPEPLIIPVGIKTSSISWGDCE